MRSAKKCPLSPSSAVCVCVRMLFVLNSRPNLGRLGPPLRQSVFVLLWLDENRRRAAAPLAPLRPALTKQKNNGGSTHGSLAISLSLTLHGRPPRATRLRFVQNTDNDEAILEPECLPILSLAWTLTRARHMLQYDMLRWPSHGLRHSSWPKKRSRLVLDAIVLTDDPTLQTMGLGSGQMYAYHVVHILCLDIKIH
jgi:hypothetical protein